MACGRFQIARVLSTEDHKNILPSFFFFFFLQQFRQSKLADNMKHIEHVDRWCFEYNG